MISKKQKRVPVQNLKALLERLLKSKIDFVLIGGFASVTYGSTLVTQDLDICIAITPETVTSLRQILADLNPKHRMNPNFKPSFLDHPKDLKGVNNIYLETDFGILDIISDVQPAGNFHEIKSRALELQLYGYKCQVISIEDLIKVKESMQRPKDLATLEELKIILANKK